jgi:hypothetical protein
MQPRQAHGGEFANFIVRPHIKYSSDSGQCGTGTENQPLLRIILKLLPQIQQL